MFKVASEDSLILNSPVFSLKLMFCVLFRSYFMSCPECFDCTLILSPCLHSLYIIPAGVGVNALELLFFVSFYFRFASPISESKNFIQLCFIPLFVQLYKILFRAVLFFYISFNILICIPGIAWSATPKFIYKLLSATGYRVLGFLKHVNYWQL